MRWHKEQVGQCDCDQVLTVARMVGEVSETPEPSGQSKDTDRYYIHERAVVDREGWELPGNPYSAF